MSEQTIVDVLEQDHVWVRSDGTAVRLDALDPSEARSVLASLKQRASLLWFAAMWREDRRYIGRDVIAADIVSPVHWLDDRPLVRGLERAVRLGARRSAPMQAFATTA